MTAEINPGLILVLGGLIMPLLPQVLRGAVMIAVPIAAAWYLLQLPFGTGGTIWFFGMQLVTLRVDELSFVFGTMFLLAVLVSGIYSLHVPGWLQPMAALTYAGSAMGAVFAGDLVTFFVFWEITAITSVFLIWAQGSERSFASGMRYLLVQVTAGVVLLSGVMIQHYTTGSIAFERLGDVDWAALNEVPLATLLILISFGVKAAFPLLHNWLHDAYPSATITGTVWLSAFTTKLAIYALVRGFPGSDILIPIGATMAVGMIVFATLTNDIRRLLSYALNSQLGFMVIGVGVGSSLALNGAVAHAVCSTLYQALLFMVAGAVIYRTGTGRISELGGLARAMPWTMLLALIGALSIAAAPAFSGFVSKSLIMSGAMKDGQFLGWIAMVIASGAVMLHAGLKLPYFVFFRRAPQIQCDEAPWNMLLAMFATAGASMAIGAYPEALYAMLPYDAGYEPYTGEHIVTQFQLLAFAALGFALLLRFGLLPMPTRSIVLDTDWFTRVLGYNLAATLLGLSAAFWSALSSLASSLVSQVDSTLDRSENPKSILNRTWSTGVMAFTATVMLAAYLLLFYLR